jgi:uncharacterized membrane protein YgcG
VKVTIPEPGGIEQFKFYTGRKGERGTHARLVEQTVNSITLETTVPLPPGTGFTVVVSWPKGLVDEPGFVRRWSWFIRDFLQSSAAGTGLLILVGYYFFTWTKVGRDPQPGPIIPLFSPPENISPAAGRYILKMGFDQKSFAAVLVNMAVKGVIRIEQDKNDYTLYLLTRGVERLTPAELAVRKKLFAEGEVIKLVQKNNGTIRAAISALQKKLRTDLLNIYFKVNRSRLLPGILISIAVVGSIVLSSKDRAATAGISMWLIIWTGGMPPLLARVVNSWRALTVLGRSFGSWKQAIRSTIFFLPFMAGWFVGIFFLLGQVSPLGVVMLVGVVLINVVFAYLLKAPTVAGRKIMDQLEGFRMYLSVAEKDRLNMLNPPEKTPELFERFFPWALALDVEQQWCDQFADLLNQVSTGQQQYSPSWYSSSHSLSRRSFSSALGSSFAASILSSSRAPGSSSGFSSGSGGGSSGGGGGGGGGGW